VEERESKILLEKLTKPPEMRLPVKLSREEFMTINCGPILTDLVVLRRHSIWPIKGFKKRK
jgi:hypothetical protein